MYVVVAKDSISAIKYPENHRTILKTANIKGERRQARIQYVIWEIDAAAPSSGLVYICIYSRSLVSWKNIFAQVRCIYTVYTYIYTTVIEVFEWGIRRRFWQTDITTCIYIYISIGTCCRVWFSSSLARNFWKKSAEVGLTSWISRIFYYTALLE